MPEAAIGVGDRIVKVNGVRGPGWRLLEECPVALSLEVMAAGDDFVAKEAK